MHDPEGYWADQARRLHWDKSFSTVLDDSKPPFFKWFTHGELKVSSACMTAWTATWMQR